MNKAKWLSEEDFHIVVLEKTPESPLDSKKVKLVRPKRNKPWVFTGRTDIEAEVPILWSLDAKSELTGKDPDVGKDWGQEKGPTGDEMVGWHHKLNGHESEQAPGEWRKGKPGMLQSMECKESDTLRDQTATTKTVLHSGFTN